MKTLLFTLALISLPVQAQITFFNDSLGMPLGTANQIGNTTFYSNSLGLPLGTAQTVVILLFIVIALDCHWELQLLHNQYPHTHRAITHRPRQLFQQRLYF